MLFGTVPAPLDRGDHGVRGPSQKVLKGTRKAILYPRAHLRMHPAPHDRGDHGVRGGRFLGCSPHPPDRGDHGVRGGRCAQGAGGRIWSSGKISTCPSHAPPATPDRGDHGVDLDRVGRFDAVSCKCLVQNWRREISVRFLPLPNYRKIHYFWRFLFSWVSHGVFMYFSRVSC